MAAPFVRASSSNSGTGTVTVARPSGLKNGDVCMIILGMEVALVTPTGGEAFSLGFSRDNGTQKVGIYWKRVQDAASEPATYSIAGGVGNTVTAQSLAITNAKSSGSPFEASTGGGDYAAGGAQSVSGITTTKDFTMVLGCRVDGTGGSRISAATCTDPSMAEVQDFGTVSGTGVANAAAQGVKETAGATGNFTWTESTGTAGTALVIGVLGDDAPSFRSVGTSAAGSTATQGSLSPGAPADIKTGDLLLAYLVSSFSIGAGGYPTGISGGSGTWVELKKEKIAPGANTDVYMSVWGKIVTDAASEPANYTATYQAVNGGRTAIVLALGGMSDTATATAYLDDTNSRGNVSPNDGCPAITLEFEDAVFVAQAVNSNQAQGDADFASHTNNSISRSNLQSSSAGISIEIDQMQDTLTLGDTGAISKGQTITRDNVCIALAIMSSSGSVVSTKLAMVV